MFRIDNSTAVAALPVVPPVGNPGYFTNGNPISAQPATIVDDWWTNTIQEEILTVVTVGGGLTPNKDDRTQLWQAIQHMVATGVGGAPDYDPFLPLVGGTLYAAGGNDLLTMQVDAGHYARIRYLVAGVRLWLAGADSAGRFVINDGTAGLDRLVIDTAGAATFPGHVNVNNGLAVTGAITGNSLTISGGAISASGNITSAATISATLDVVANRSVYSLGNMFARASLYFGTGTNIFLYDAGNGYLTLNGGLDVIYATTLRTTLQVNGNGAFNANLVMGGQISFGNGANGLQWNPANSYLTDYGSFAVTGNILTNGDLTVVGNIGMGGAINFGGGVNGLQWNSANSYLTDYGNFAVTGACAIGSNLTVSGALTVGNSFYLTGNISLTGSIYCQNPASGGVYALGLTAGVYGVTTDGNIRITGAGASSGGNQLTMSNTFDGSRSYSVHVNGDHWIVSEAAGSPPTYTTPWFQVMAGGIEVMSGGQAYKAGGMMWADSSERRFKQDIEDYATGLDVVSRLQPRSYKFNGQGGTTANGKTYFGLIADEVEDVMPEMLGQWERDGETVTTVDATALVYALVNSVRELAGRVATLEGRA